MTDTQSSFPAGADQYAVCNLARRGMAGRGLAWQGLAWCGEAGHAVAWRGKAWQGNDAPKEGVVTVGKE